MSKSSVIELSALVVPPGGVLVLTVSEDTTLQALQSIRQDAHVFFAPRKVLVLRVGDIKIGCISWADAEAAGVSAEGAAWAMEGAHNPYVNVGNPLWNTDPPFARPDKEDER